MSKKVNINDVFRSHLIKDAWYDGFFEMPKIRTSSLLPEKLISFSKAMERKTTDFDQWVMFYEHDVKFERLWNNSNAYINRLKMFKGVISPDFSLYRNMPLCYQLWNTYRSRALAVWLQSNGVEVIPNVRWNDERTYLFAFNGIEKGKTVSVGTHGCIKQKDDREYFKKGLGVLVDKLTPKTIIVYGSAPKDIFGKYKGIKIIAFESEFSKSIRQVKA